MIKTIFALFICVSSIGISFGQVEISGGIYSDSTLTEPVLGVKLTLKSETYKKSIKPDKNGKFKILVKNPTDDLHLEIKKKDYVTLVIKNVFFDKTKSKIEFDVILRKALSVHDENYKGSSELIKRY